MSDDILDTIGLLCPLPVLKARKALKSVPTGGRLTVQTDDPAALIDMPHFCAEAGHKLVESTTEGTVTTWVLEKG